MSQPSRNMPFLKLAWSATLLLVLIALAAVARRAFVLLFPTHAPRFAPAAALDANFAAHSLLTLIHILPAALLILLMPIQFIGAIRQKHIRLHRLSGKLILVLGSIVGVSSLVMSYRMSIGGANETAATTLFAILFLLFLAAGYGSVRRGRIEQHREWMLRAFGVALGIATTRPIMGLFFAARRLNPHEFFGIAFWLGFTLTLLAAETWIHLSRLPNVHV